MGKKEKIFVKANNSPQNITFDELCYLSKKVGFKKKKGGKGDHEKYFHPTIKVPLVFQPGKNGKAMPYQVRELLSVIEEYELMGD